MRRSIPGPPCPCSTDPTAPCDFCGSLWMETEPIGTPAWAVVLVVVGGAALLMALVFFVLNSGLPEGTGATPGRGVSTYGPPEPESHVVP